MRYMNLHDAQIDLLHEPKTSDLTIRCKGREWKCQSVILSQRCDFFAAVCNADFVESNTRVIELKDDDPETVEVILEYLYTLAVPAFQGHDIFDFGMRVLLLADKYDLPQLREAAKRDVESRLVGLKKFRTHDDKAKSDDLAFIRVVWNYNLSDREEMIASLLKALLTAHSAFITNGDFQDLLESNQDLWKVYTIAISQRLQVTEQNKKPCKMYPQRRTGPITAIDCSSDSEDDGRLLLG